MRAAILVPLAAVVALGTGCGGDDDGTATGAERRLTSARYAGAIDAYCARIDRANARASAAVESAAAEAPGDADRILAAAKQAQGSVLDTFVREADRFGDLRAPRRYDRFHAAFRAERPKVVAELRAAQRTIRAATTLEELGNAAPPTSTLPDFPRALEARAPACEQNAKLVSRAKDQDAKSDARNAVSSVESCFTATGDYAECTTAAALPDAPAEVVSGRPDAGQIAVSRASRTGYRVLAPSGSGNRFAITRRGAEMVRSCSSAVENGGCRDGRW